MYCPKEVTIRKIKANSGDAMRYIGLYDDNNTLVCSWDGGKRHRDKEQEIFDNSSIVGVYGRKTRRDSIVNFGFIITTSEARFKAELEAFAKEKEEFKAKNPGWTVYKPKMDLYGKGDVK